MMLLPEVLMSPGNHTSIAQTFKIPGDSSRHMASEGVVRQESARHATELPYYFSARWSIFIQASAVDPLSTPEP